jgi:hypothetical protein
MMSKDSDHDHWALLPLYLKEIDKAARQEIINAPYDHEEESEMKEARS